MASQEIVLNQRYKLITQQASGGMAVVYKAQDLQLRRIVAVKVLRPSLTGDPAFLERFRQEAMNVANLSHPNIVTVHDFQQDGTTYYIVMEWVEGQDLKKIIRQAAPLPLDRSLRLAIQICDGIGYAHRAGLVHADIKPQNILVTPEDIVKITDFGIAQALAHTQPQAKQDVVWGSPHYFAPEQAQGELPTPYSDVYAIGIVMFEMLTGKLPFTGTDQQELALAHIRDAVPHASDYNPRIPVNFDRIIYKVMSKNPNDRFANADALGRILRSYQQQGQENTIDQAALPPQNPSATPSARPVSSGFTPAGQAFGSDRPGTNTPKPQQPAGVPIPPRGQTPYPAPQSPQAAQYPPQRAGQGSIVLPPPQQGATPPPIPVQGNNQAGQSRYQQPQQIPNPPQAPGNSAQYTGPYSVNNPNNPSINRGQGASVRPGSGPYTPNMNQQPPVYAAQADQMAGQRPYSGVSPYSGTNTPGRSNGAPNYQLDRAPSPINTVTIILGLIAGVLVLGLIPLWLAVLASLGG
jgi:serine/threonine-protein kinase